MTVTTLQYLPPQDIGRGAIQVTIDALGTPFIWFAERIDRGSYFPGTYRFYGFGSNGEFVEPLSIPPVSGLYPRLHPFVDGRLLALFTRIGRQEPRPNATIYSPGGELLASFHTADAVEDAQITADGQIWVSHFDECYESRLECFDQNGSPLFQVEPFLEEQGLPYIDDCYALNVSSDTETWIYYYSDFPLVRLEDRRLAGRWDASAIPGAHAFAVDGRRALFAGTYERKDSLFLLDFASGAVEELQPIYESGLPMPFSSYRCSGRGTRLYLQDSQQLYAIDLRDLPYPDATSV